MLPRLREINYLFNLIIRVNLIWKDEQIIQVPISAEDTNINSIYENVFQQCFIT